MKRKKLVSALAAVMTASVLLTACGQSGSTTSSSDDEKSASLSTAKTTVIKATDMSKLPAQAKARKDTLIIGMGKPNPGMYLPYLSDSSYNDYINKMVFCSLGTISDDGTPEPGMASWTVSPDGLTYTFKIKDGAKYSNGTPVTADDVKFTFEYLLDPSCKTRLFDPTSTYIKGAEDFHAGKSTDLPGIQVVNDKTVKITLSQPNATAIYTLASTYIMSKDYYGKNYKPGDASSVEALQNAPMGSGAWILKKVKEGQEWDFDANPNYWGGKPKIKHIIIKYVTDETALQELKSGGVDMVEASSTTCSDENVSEIKDSGFVNSYINPTWGFGQLVLNDKKPMFSDVRVRQALTYGLDRADIDKAAFGKYAQPINIPLPIVSWAYSTDGITNYKYDVAKANKLLDEAGWKKGADGIRTKDGVRFQINFLESTGVSTAETIASVAKENYKKLGIDLEIQPMDFTQIITKCGNHDFDMAFMGASFNTADPDQSSSYETNGIGNYGQYSSATVDDLLRQELKQTDKSKRKVIFEKLDKQLNNDMPVIPVYERNDLYPISGRVKGITPTSFKDFTYYLPTAELK